MGAGRARPSCPGAFPAGAARGKKGARCGAGGKGQVRHGKKGRQVPHGGKGCAVRHGAKKPAGAHGGKGCAVRRGKKGRQVRHGFRPALCLPGESAEGACRAGAVPLAAAGEGGEKGKGGISLFPRPWRPRPMCRGRGRRRCGGAPGCAAGAKQALRGFPEEGCPEGASGRKKGGGAGGGNPPPALSPFLFAAPLGRRRTFFGTFCGALPTHKSIGRVRTRRRCRRRDFAGRPPRCRPRGRWSGGCRQRGARPPR